MPLTLLKPCDFELSVSLYRVSDIVQSKPTYQAYGVHRTGLFDSLLG